MTGTDKSKMLTLIKDALHDFELYKGKDNFTELQMLSSIIKDLKNSEPNYTKEELDELNYLETKINKYIYLKAFW